jgi:hypothetical protein
MNVENSPKDQAPNYAFTLTFNPEILRIASYLALIAILVVGLIITKTLVHVDPQTTVLYRTHLVS